MLISRHHSNTMTRAVIGLVDIACVAVAGLLASLWATGHGEEAEFAAHLKSHAAYPVVFLVVWFVIATDRPLYLFSRNESAREHLGLVLKSAAIALVFSGFLVGFFRRGAFERDYMLYFGALTLAFLMLFRASVWWAVATLRHRGVNQRRFIIIGANSRSKHLLELLAGPERFGYDLVGIVDDEPERMALFGDESVPYLGKVEDLEQVLRSQVVDDVFVSLPVKSAYENILGIAGLCESVGAPVRMVADLFPAHIAIRKVVQLDDVPILSLSPVPEHPAALTLKRVVDFFGASTGLLVLAIPFLIIALLIKLDSKGPVFFAQERVGRNQRRFNILKFRSMVVNAEELKKDLMDQNEADGPVFKMRKDPRVTRMGRILRKTSLDEFPQLINVWRGQMSLVGPRPPIPSEVEEYTWEDRRRLSVKPGMTGLWQISGRSDVDFQTWVKLDLEYIDSWSIAGDIKILFKTVRVVLLGKGAA